MISNTFTDLFSLQGKNAVVTGGVGILGKRFCCGLAEFKANVAVVDIDGASAITFAKELSKEYGVNAIGVACDITSPESVKEMTQQVVKAFGSIEILHNNAQGNDVSTSFEDCTLEDWRVTSSVDEEGYFLVAQAVGKQMLLQGGGGSIIQTSSIYGITGPDHRIYEESAYNGKRMGSTAVYSFSKAGVVGLTKYLATYWADEGIRVNTITPGGVESGQSETFKSKYSARVPLGRMANRDEIVGALIFLASDASSYITGQNIVVDGGLSTW